MRCMPQIKPDYLLPNHAKPWGHTQVWVLVLFANISPIRLLIMNSRYFCTCVGASCGQYNNVRNFGRARYVTFIINNYSPGSNTALFYVIMTITQTERGNLFWHLFTVQIKRLFSNFQVNLYRIECLLWYENSIYRMRYLGKIIAY